MKSPFQNNHALLDDIQAVLAKRGRNLWWLGQSGFLVAQNGRGLLFDPYLSDSLTRKYANTDKPHVRMTELVVNPAALGSLGIIDVITSSHNHTDHLDAETLAPLLPRYVSTVDSGNLAGHLLTLSAGLLECPDQKILGPEVFSGLRDTLGVLKELAGG